MGSRNGEVDLFWESGMSADIASWWQGTPTGSGKPEKVHDKVITWTEHHPVDKDEMITSSADGTVKVWKA